MGIEPADTTRQKDQLGYFPGGVKAWERSLELKVRSWCTRGWKGVRFVKRGEKLAHKEAHVVQVKDGL